MRTQRIAKLVYLALPLSGMAALALGIGASNREPDEARTSDLTFEHRWPAFESKAPPEPPVVADAPIEPLPSESDAKPQKNSAIRVAALDPQALSLVESDQPASKGYIFYFNSPTHWKPVPLPEAASEARAPHNNGIRAEIEQAAMLFGVDMRMMKAFARIESGYNPKVTTGKYKCLFQLSNYEFNKYWQGEIYDIRDCSMAAARKFATEAAEFEKDVGRPATAAEIYCIHQQGYQGCSFHYAAPHQLAWKNMYLTAEGQERGEAWARKAIWGNVPSDLKPGIKGGVESLTSAQFIAIWTERVEQFMARKSEPPAVYVEQASKSKARTKLAAIAKKKVAATGNKQKAAATGSKQKVAAIGSNKKKAAASSGTKKKSKTKVASR